MVEEYLEELKNGNDLNDCVLDYYIDRKYSNTDELKRIGRFTKIWLCIRNDN